MFRKLLATTALATLLATGAYAQDTTAPAPAAPADTTAPATTDPAAPVVRADGSLVTNIVGEDVYNGTADDAESIGKVTDVVFDKEGQAKQIIIGVGGFLGLGTKDVAFDYAKLQWAEKNGDRWLVAQTSKEELTAQAAFDRTPYEPAPAAMETAPSATGADPAGTTAPAGNTAQDGTATAPATDTAQATPPAEMVEPDGALASQIVGENVYNGPGDNAEDIGTVNDIVLSKEGMAESLIIGVGGFLGLGQKNVAFDYDKAKWAERNGDRWLVVETTKEQLEGLPDFDRKAYDPAPAAAAASADAPAQVTPATTAADGTAATQDTAEAPATTGNAEAPAATSDAAQAPADAPATDAAQAPADTAATDTAQAPAGTAATDTTQTAAIDRSTLTEMPADKISADNLIGTTVYGADDANLGEISDIVLTGDNSVDAIVVDVGGFLGIGEKPVAVAMDNLKFMNDKDGNTYLYTNLTKEQLESQAAYDKGSYADKRDEQRLILR
jgi:sporulation protein YlmC with PRC-barrel domain